MRQRIAFCLAILIGLTVNAQTINLRGVVSNQAGKPIANAILTLVKQGLKDTTGTDGAYSFTKSTAVVMPMLVPQNTNIFMNRGFLEFSLPNASPVKIEIFDVQGNLLKREAFKTAPAGFYRFNIEENARAVKLLVVKASIGRDEFTFRYLPLHSNKYTVNSSAESYIPSSGKLAKIAAIDDTLKITAPNYKAKAIPITSYDLQQNITLDSNSADGKNAPGPSVGCGKTLGSALKSINKSGTYDITSSGTGRKFIIDIPENYDKDKPYRLIFGMHCMYGSAIKVAGTDDGKDQTAYFYHVKTLADKDNIQCIYVAPQGDEGGTWNPSTDPKFFSDLLKLVKDTLCVDTTRVFASGFSFGAMYTYALSLAYPKQLRAVSCYAPANWNFEPQPTNNHMPIAYFQTTGTGDGLCSWINDDANKKGGKYCVLQHAEDNGCNTNIIIQLATSGKHVVTEFTGCKDGYPVRFASFNGQHQCNASDPGSSTDWIPVETWEFFKRF